MGELILKGTFIGWILRDADRIPGFFPISPQWLLILFGLGTINYAKHPEGVIENLRLRSQERRDKRAARGGRSVVSRDEPSTSTFATLEEPAS